MTTATAGTLESMDCLVTATRKAPGSGMTIELEGSSAARFRTAMEKTVRDTAADLQETDLLISVNDHGALDVVLAARVETAIRRLRGER